jgi:hypothetical protein
VDGYKELVAGVRRYYNPVGFMEELLVEKIAVDLVREARIIGYEQKQLAARGFTNEIIDRILRCQTASERRLFRFMRELERMQDNRKAAGGSYESYPPGAGGAEGTGDPPEEWSPLPQGGNGLGQAPEPASENSGSESETNRPNSANNCGNWVRLGSIEQPADRSINCPDAPSAATSVAADSWAKPIISTPKEPLSPRRSLCDVLDQYRGRWVVKEPAGSRPPEEICETNPTSPCPEEPPKGSGLQDDAVGPAGGLPTVQASVSGELPRDNC